MRVFGIHIMEGTKYLRPVQKSWPRPGHLRCREGRKEGRNKQRCICCPVPFPHPLGTHARQPRSCLRRAQCAFHHPKSHHPPPRQRHILTRWVSSCKAPRHHVLSPPIRNHHRKLQPTTTTVLLRARVILNLPRAT